VSFGYPSTVIKYWYYANEYVFSISLKKHSKIKIWFGCGMFKR